MARPAGPSRGSRNTPHPSRDAGIFATASFAAASNVRRASSVSCWFSGPASCQTPSAFPPHSSRAVDTSTRRSEMRIVVLPVFSSMVPSMTFARSSASASLRFFSAGQVDGSQLSKSSAWSKTRSISVQSDWCEPWTTNWNFEGTESRAASNVCDSAASILKDRPGLGRASRTKAMRLTCATRASAFRRVTAWKAASSMA